MVKSPVLHSLASFNEWYKEANGFPVETFATGGPKSFPCIAILHVWKDYVDGVEEICQDMEYVYMRDFTDNTT